MRAELQRALELATTLPANELPELCADLERIRVTCYARLASPRVEARPDELLTVEQAAERLKLSKDFLYRNSARLGGKRIGRALRFSSNALDTYLRKARL